MAHKYLNSLMVLALVTNFVQPSLARQLELKTPVSAPVKTNINGSKNQTIDFKNLPLILNTKNLKIDKHRDLRIENLDLQRKLGPRTTGGGNICAFNITATTAFIIKNIEAVPFENQKQTDQFLQKINTVRFFGGSNLKVRGQSVNAINYPQIGHIVVDSSVCEYLDSNKEGGAAFLLHEYLGVAGIDDTAYQISSSFAKKVKDNSKDATYGTHVVSCQGENNQVIQLSFASTEGADYVYKIKTQNLLQGFLPETITGPIVGNGQETDNSSPSRIAFSDGFGNMVLIKAEEPFGRILDGSTPSMDVVVLVEDVKSNSKCTLVK